MNKGLNLMDGSRIPAVVPSRFYTYTAEGRRFSAVAAVDFIADCGFDGMDVSFDTMTDLEDAARSVLFSLGNRAAARGVTLPMCHLPFAMPNPDQAPAMRRFAGNLREALDAAAFLHIPVAVVHPIVRHGSVCSERAWLEENLAFLSPLVELARARGVELAVENMTGQPYPGHPDEVVYGSRAAHVVELADRLSVGICWDFGHANLTGLCQSAELSEIGSRLRAVHIHDNDGRTDRHLIPGDGSVDWDDVAQGLRAIAYTSATGRCLDFELKTSDLSADPAVRYNHAVRALKAARWLAEKI